MQGFPSAVTVQNPFYLWSIHMCDFIKGQTEERANLIFQVRDILDRAESEARGLSVDDLGHVERLEARIADIDTGISVARRSEERQAEVAEAARGFVPAVEARDDNAILRSIAMGETRGHEFRAALTPTSGSGVVPYSFYDQVFTFLQNRTPCSPRPPSSTRRVATRFRFLRLRPLELTRRLLLVLLSPSPTRLSAS